MKSSRGTHITEKVRTFVRFLRRLGELDQSWFWTDEWQTLYWGAKEDLAAGRYRDFVSVEDALEELKRARADSVL